MNQSEVRNLISPELYRLTADDTASAICFGKDNNTETTLVTITILGNDYTAPPLIMIRKLKQSNKLQDAADALSEFKDRQ